MTPTSLGALSGAIALGLPILALCVLGIAMLVARDVAETRVHQIVAGSLTGGLLAALATAATLPFVPGHALVLSAGSAVALRGYHLDLGFRFDPVGVTYLVLGLGLCGLVGLFSSRYMHKEDGFHRFYFLLLLFALGVAVVAVGEGLDLLFAGWELIGLSSALLIAFFHRRRHPVENGLRAFAMYRVSDVGLLSAVVLAHAELGHTRLDALGAAPHAALLGTFLVVGAMAKGGIVPMTGWVPRAMEGPTPSSAIFYGALSLHASPFLLLRAAPVFEDVAGVRIAIAALGLLTALHASWVGRVQTDIKSTLAYASVAQVGLMWVEIAAGLYPLALLHLVGHAVLRTWQLLRAPSLLHDRHVLHGALGAAPGPTGRQWEALLPLSFRIWAYRFGLHRWGLDAFADGVAAAALAIPRAVDAIDRWWIARLDREVPLPEPPVPQPEGSAR